MVWWWTVSSRTPHCIVSGRDCSLLGSSEGVQIDGTLALELRPPHFPAPSQ